MPDMNDDVQRGVAKALESLKASHPELMVLEGGPETDLVAKAMELAAQGKLPVVRALGAKLTSRANEGMLEAAAAKRKIIYIGAHAGLIPATKMTHQAVRDIGIVRTIPEIAICEPGTEAEAELMTKYLVEKHPRGAYMRLASSPGSVDMPLPAGHEVGSGRGWKVREGTHVALIAAGPVMLAEAVAAADLLEREENMKVKIINLPWHVDIDAAWLADLLNDVKFAIALDNHVMRGGQSEELRRIFKYDALFSGIVGRHISMDGFPESGDAADVLKHHGLDADAIAGKTLEMING